MDLECYDVINDEKFTLFKKLHKEAFNSCRHFCDENNKRNLIITSSFDKHVKIINFKKEKSEIINDLDFEKIKNANINNSFLLDNKTVIISFSFYINYQEKSTIQFYSINNDKNKYITKIQDIGFILGLNTFYYKKNNQYYILISSEGGIFVYNQYSLYYKYITQEEGKENKIEFVKSQIYEKNDKLILVGACLSYNFLYFWDFLEKNLIKKLDINYGITDICLWNNDYIFASLKKGESNFILINLNNYIIEKQFLAEEKDQNSSEIKVLGHESKGDYLISISQNGKIYLYKAA